LNIYEYNQNKIQTVSQNKTIQQGNSDIQNLNLKITSIRKGIDNLSKNINKTKIMMNAQIKKVKSSLSDADKLLVDINDPNTLETLKNMLDKTKYKLNGTLRFAAIALQSFNNSISTYEDRIDKKNQKLNATNIDILRV
jgi:hypothetical protein